jgi:hypothetical protein
MQKKYIGCKIIVGEPMTKGEWLMFKYNIESVVPNEPGYKVTYPDGYVSWSPKEAFENAYREITEGEMKLLN